MPKKIDHAERRRLVTDVTRKLILQGGLEAATMREIAKEAGFANGALKHFFDSKDDIIQATYAGALEGTTESVVLAAAESSGLDSLKATVYTAMPDDEEKRDSGRVLLAFWERAVTEDSMRAEYRKHLDGWRAGMLRDLRRAREDGDVVAPESDEVLADELVLLTAGFTVMGLLAPDVLGFAAQKEQLDAFFARITGA